MTRFSISKANSNSRSIESNAAKYRADEESPSHFLLDGNYPTAPDLQTHPSRVHLQSQKFCCIPKGPEKSLELQRPAYRHCNSNLTAKVSPHCLRSSVGWVHDKPLHEITFPAVDASSEALPIFHSPVVADTNERMAGRESGPQNCQPNNCQSCPNVRTQSNE